MSLVPMEFPVDQFIECIRNNRNKSQKFLEQAKNSNTGWIYEIIKIVHNTILETKQLPNTKLNALFIIRDLMELCKVQCINLIEVYILPIVYEIAVQKAKEKGDRKGSKFFQQSNKGSKIPNIQETGIKFMALCTQILVAGSIIKPKRLFLSQQLRQKSEFAECFQKYKNYDTETTSNELSNFQNFSSDFKSKGRYRFLKDLENFSKNQSGYSQYFVTKMIQSVQSDNNPLFNMGAQSVSSIANDLDMRKLLKYGDPIITSPLIDELILKLNTHPSFMAKKNCLSLLTDFIKWGDSEAFVKLCNDSSLHKIALRIAEVDGRSGMTVGQDIYPQVKGQRDGKRKFYTQYLKSIQIISKCLGSQKLQIQQAAKIEQLYNYFKDEKKYVFPQNLMTKRIQSDFKQNLSYNEQRNIFLMKKIKLQANNSSDHQNKKVADQTLINQINKNMEECIEQMMKVTTNEKQVDARMTQLGKLKDHFQEQIYKLGEISNIQGQEVDQILENGQQVSKACQKIQEIYKLYKNKSIGFKQFKERHENLTQEFQFESQYSMAQSDRNKVGQNAQNVKNSLQDVVNSFKINKGEEQNFILANQIQPKHQIAVKQIKKPAKTPNQALKQTEQDVLNQITSSIVSKKSQKQRIYLEEPSRISQSQNESGSKFSKASKFIVKGSNFNDQQYKLSQPKNSSFQEQSGIYKNTNPNNFVKVEKRQQKQSSQFTQQNYSNVDYVGYNSPESLKIQKNYQTAQNFMSSNPDTPKNIYVSTNPINLDNRSQQGTQNKFDSNQNQSFQKNSKNEWNQYGIVTYKEQPWRNSDRNSNSASICKNADNQISKQYFANNYNNAGFVGSYGSQGFSQNKQAFPQKYKQEQNQFLNMQKNQNNFANNSNANLQKMKPEQSKLSYDSNKIVKKQMSNSGFSSKKYGIDGQQNLNSKIDNKEASVKSLKESENMRLTNQNYQIKYQDSRISQRQNLNSKNSKFNEQYISEIKQPNYYSIGSQIEEDLIKEPKLKPLEQSYYRPEDIENQVKQCQNPQFKDCFKIEKQMIRSPTQKANIISVMQSRARSQTGSMNQYNRIAGRPHEEYLINKIRKQQNKQNNLQNIELSKRILNLKDDNSRLRNQLTRKQRQVSSGSRSNQKQFSECVQFSRSKQHSNYVSPFKSKASSPSQLGAASRVSAIAIQGQPINQSFFSRYLGEVNQDKMKKACLKNKSLILKTDIWQIGTMLKQSFQLISLTLYLTPNCKINNFSYTISSQPNLQLDYLSKQWSQIPENKQIKIQIDCALKNINYNLPLINIYYVKGSQKKNLSFYLPLTINKFIIFNQPNIARIGKNLIRPEIIRRTEQFQINKKVLKTNSITQMMPFLTKIQQDINKKLFVYGTTAVFNNNQFQLLIVTKGNEKVVMQALVENSKQNNMADYLLYTFKKLIQK